MSDRKCEVCGRELLLYKCKYCGGTFCNEHRSQEDHSCPGSSVPVDEFPEDDRHLLYESLSIAGPGVAVPGPKGWPLKKKILMATAAMLALIFLVGSIGSVIILIGILDGPISHDTIPVRNSTGSIVAITNYKNATDPTYDQLMQFLREDNTDSFYYADPDFTCADFARQVHDSAEAKGIRCAIVAIDFEDRMPDYNIYNDGTSTPKPADTTSAGHGLNMFNTTDRGPVYIDCTGAKYGEPAMKDKIAYVSEGKEYNTVDIDNATGIDYSSYEFYKQRYVSYISRLREHNRAVQAYNAEVNMYSGSYIPDDIYRRLVLTKENLEAEESELSALRATIGDFNYPTGYVKEVKVYW